MHDNKRVTPRVFVTRAIVEAGLTMLQEGAKVEVWRGPEDKTPSKEEIIKGVKRADVLLCLLTETIDRVIIEANPRLLGISNHAVGYDNIDVKNGHGIGDSSY